MRLLESRWSLHREDDMNKPEWLWGNATLNGSRAPVCSKCKCACAQDAMASHQETCWKQGQVLAEAEFSIECDAHERFTEQMFTKAYDRAEKTLGITGSSPPPGWSWSDCYVHLQLLCMSLKVFGPNQRTTLLATFT